MAKNTNTALREQVIYSVYVRNHTPEGTFRAVIPDLDRIRALGTDIVWFMPIHPIGREGQKGQYSAVPYAEDSRLRHGQSRVRHARRFQGARGRDPRARA